MACVLLTSSLFASDYATNARGKKVCSNGQNTAAAVNPNTSTTAVAEKNQNGVTTTQTTNGGKTKTKNEMGVAQRTRRYCLRKKGKYHEGCKKE